MSNSTVQILARVLRVLLIFALLLNVLALLLVPASVMVNAENLFGGAGTFLQGAPFSTQNAVSLRRAAVCSFCIAGAALLRTIWGLWFYQSLRPLATYNALFVPIFTMFGLLCLVMSALFRQATEMKAENDLTI